MSYRRIILFGFAAYFCVLMWRVATIGTAAAEDLADALPWALVVILMLPEGRFKVGELLSGLKIWKNDEDEKP